MEYLFLDDTSLGKIIMVHDRSIVRWLEIEKRNAIVWSFRKLANYQPSADA